MDNPEIETETPALTPDEEKALKGAGTVFLDSNGVECETIQVGGIIRDSSGREWVVPAEDLEDLGDQNIKPFGDLKLDPAFHYQTCRAEGELSGKLAQGFALVTREEVGLPSIKKLEREFGMAESTYVRLHDAVLIKIPLVLYERIERKKLRTAQAVRDATEPSPEMLARMKARAKTNRDLEDSLGRQNLPFRKELIRKKDQPTLTR